MWKLNNMYFNSQWVRGEITREIRKCFETNENKITIYQDLWDTEKAVLRQRFIVINVYIKGEGKSQINNLTLYLKGQEK